ncbi:MAG: redox-sensing transcriptional repressor Rex, partial [Actinomycetes bacterium]
VPVRARSPGDVRRVDLASELQILAFHQQRKQLERAGTREAVG